jgi:hypothetical protein
MAGMMGGPTAPAGVTGNQGAVHPAAAAGATAGRGMLAPTPTGPSNPAPQGAPMGGAPHPASNVPIRPINGPIRGSMG